MTDDCEALDVGEHMEIDGTLTLVSKEGSRFPVSDSEISLSNLVKNVLITDTEATEIDLPNIDEVILGHVVEFLKLRNGIESDEIKRPLRSTNMHEVTELKDADFINKFPMQTLLQIVLAANYMDISSLLHLGCAKVASVIKGKSPAEIKEALQQGMTQESNSTSPGEVQPK